MHCSAPMKLLLLPLFAVLLAGCGAAIWPPAAVEEPRTVWLLQHARHSSLLLTTADSSRVRYAYGDWAWYVEQREGLYSGARALLWPSRAALGRLSLPPAQAGERLGRVIGVGIDHAHCLRLDANQVDRLLAELDAYYHASDLPPHFSATRNLYFVTYPRAYTLLHNSNQVTASWLRELGVQVRGSPALGHWELNASARDAAIDAAPTKGAGCA